MLMHQKRHPAEEAPLVPGYSGGRVSGHSTVR
jgi:hypothetical protein